MIIIMILLLDPYYW